MQLVRKGEAAAVGIFGSVGKPCIAAPKPGMLLASFANSAMPFSFVKSGICGIAPSVGNAVGNADGKPLGNPLANALNAAKGDAAAPDASFAVFVC